MLESVLEILRKKVHIFFIQVHESLLNFSNFFEGLLKKAMCASFKQMSGGACHPYCMTDTNNTFRKSVESNSIIFQSNALI